MQRLEENLEGFYRHYDGKRNPASAAKISGLTSRGASFANRTLDRIRLDSDGSRYSTMEDMYTSISGEEVTAAGLVSLNTVARVHLVTRGTLFGCWAVCVAAQSDDPEFDLSEDRVFLQSRKVLRSMLNRASEVLLLGRVEGASWVSEGLAAREDCGRMLAILPENIYSMTEGQMIRLCDTLGLPEKGPSRAEMELCKSNLTDMFPEYRVYDMLKPIWLTHFSAAREAEFWNMLNRLKSGKSNWRDANKILLNCSGLAVA